MTRSDQESPVPETSTPGLMRRGPETAHGYRASPRPYSNYQDARDHDPVAGAWRARIRSLSELRRPEVASLHFPPEAGHYPAISAKFTDADSDPDAPGVTAVRDPRYRRDRGIQQTMKEGGYARIKLTRSSWADRYQGPVKMSPRARRFPR
jgi:hypothetical protein